jgi:hypothetical protein
MILDSFNKFSECSGGDKNNKTLDAVVEMLIPFVNEFRKYLWRQGQAVDSGQKFVAAAAYRSMKRVP